MKRQIIKLVMLFILMTITRFSEGKAQTLSLIMNDGTTTEICLNTKIQVLITDDKLILSSSDNISQFDRSDITSIFLLPSEQKKGDINTDGSVDISDVVSIINLIASGEKEDNNDDNPPTPTPKPDPLGLCPDANHPHAIDMGTFGTWSCCNVGAKTPIDTGGFYAWAETEEKSFYSADTYNYYNPEEGWKFLTKDLSGTEYDVAHVLWGGDWCMPTSYQYETLLTLTHEIVTIKGVTGVKFTYPRSSGQNRYLFLPLPGNKVNDKIITDLPHLGSQSFYFTSNASFGDNERAKTFLCDDGIFIISAGTRWYGAPVRPIIKK